jgi:aryl-alcohol dehydrogenase-like predicted oxidoreductase
MSNSAFERSGGGACNGMSRRLFLCATLAGGAALLTGRAAPLFATASANDDSSFAIGTDRKWDNTLSYCEKEKIGFMPWAPIGGTRGMSAAALEKIAKDHGITIYQLGLAWLLHRSPVMLPIPGTSSLAHLEENMAAAKLTLNAQDWKAIDAVVSQT